MEIVKEGYEARTNPDQRVLPTTFADNLAHALRTRLRRLISNRPQPTERLDLQDMNAVGERLYERHLLYVACTRARDHLLVTGVNPASDFLEDLR